MFLSVRNVKKDQFLQNKKVLPILNLIMHIGIQGGRGSANEQACLAFCRRQNILDFRIAYLISTEAVLVALERGCIALGVFAVSSSRGGLVAETQEALPKHQFEKIDEIQLSIKHVLLAKELYPKNFYQKIISHPQALKEHEIYLKQAYPQAELVEAEDTALAAQRLSEGKYGVDALVIALKSCAEIYNLKIIESDLPANQGYQTLFYLVKKSL